MKKRLLAGLLATSIALSISMGAFPAMAATNDDFVEDREDIADYTDDSYSSGYSSSEQLFDDIIFFDLDEEVDDTAAEVIAEEDANDSSDTEIDRAADSIEETEPEDEVQDTDAAEDRNDREYPDEETKSGTNPGETGPSDAETEEDVPDSWEETPKIDSELEAAIASEDPFSYYDDDASEEEMDDDIALLAAGKTMAHEDYAYTDVSSGTEYMVDLYTDHTAKIWKLITSSGGAECILPSTIYYTDDDGVPEPTPYTVTELHLSYWSGVTSDNNNYTALVLPDTLTDIGGSLSGFKNVTEITIPGSVKVFNATLQNMKQLKTLTFDEGVDEIASGSVVSGCKSLTTIHLPSSLQKLSGTGTFSGASALTDITLPEGIAITEGSTFSECTSLESIELPASITTIPSSMFAGCSALERVTAKGTITAIGNGAFGSVTDWNDQETADTALTEIPDLSQVTSIGDRAFYGCSALETVDLHSVTTMGYAAFQGCDALSGEIDLSKLEVIPGHAFCYDPNITSVITCPTLRSIGDWAFIWADISTISLPETLNSIGTYTFYKASLSGTVALPDSLTQLGASAFSGCEEVNAIQIGSGLKDIPANAFAGCTNLKTITVNNRWEDVTIPKIDGVTVTYTIPSLEATDDKVSNAEGALSLQQAVDQANGTPVTIEKDIRLDEPVRIAAGQRVEITANVNCNIFGNNDKNLTNLFVVEPGGELSLTGALTLGGWNNTGSILVNHGKTTIDGNVVIEKSTLEGNDVGVIEDNGSSAELILENGTIQNHKIRGALSASIRVTEGASFTMNGGTIQANIANTSSSDSSSPAVLLLGASTFTMNGGSICNNSGQCGTAVYLTASSNAAKARFTMNGGSLSNNESRSYTPNSTPTGAVFVKYSAEFVLNDGTITGNCAHDGAGGGVAVMDELPTEEHGTAFTMNGGTISNNTASGSRCSGGGIYSCSNYVSLLGGRIENNSAYDGGGVYSEGNTEIYTTLHIENALITGNTADQGGGLWFCPTGDAKLYMQDGAVIYGNTAASAGDDFASPEVATGAGGNGGVTLPDYFPNGKVIQWFSDGFLYAPPGNRGTSGQGTRYNTVEYAKRVTGVQNEKKGLALKSVVSDGVSIPATGSLIITGNQASHGGGGIGANGGVVIGEATSLSYSISVKKAWDNPGYEDTQPSSVTIHLKERDTGDIVSTAELTGENGWQYTFTDLPLSPNHYTVTEQPLEGYKATYYQDADGNFIITNTHLTTPTPMPDVPAVTISVPVEKKWVNDYKWERPASIHVSLWNGDAKVKEADLTADMGWTYIFEDLPEGTYSVTEDAVPGYETLIERSDAGGFIITNTYERPLYPEPIEPIDPIPPVDPPQEEIVTPPIVPGTTGNEPNPPSTEETTSVPPTEPTEESTEESAEERSAESDPEESPIKETQETPSVSANPPKLIQTGQTWWPVFLLMFAGAGLLVFGFYKRSKENIDHE
ncbi:leucine-rich repeat protein [Faecalibacterium prausnitzii]|uniref:leucine-rich repeat protein n=1 Tax=Faecalibacterium prausnitzii TaxID=853 RepID=UPI000E3F0AC3|nr:leucine-rich repeat protein [Faecalibacterium prausnitzii]RGC34344.1 Cna B-type domain-containing protein [Faecalibacterium prausnitzii]